MKQARHAQRLKLKVGKGVKYSWDRYINNPPCHEYRDVVNVPGTALQVNVRVEVGVLVLKLFGR